MRVLNELLSNSTTVAASDNSNIATLDHIGIIDVTSVVTGANVANKTFIDADVNTTTNAVAIATHGYTTGAKVTLTTTGTLPGGLATATPYYLIAATAGTIQFASSQANALAGTAIDITSAAGGGTHTVTVTTTLAGSIKLQKNNEPADAAAIWFDIASSSQTISAAGAFNWSYGDVGYRQVRAVTAITSGTVTVATRLNGKGF